MHPKTHSLPFPARDTSNDKTRLVEVLFPPKKSQKIHNNMIFLIKSSFHIGTKKNNEVCFRTDKKLSQKNINKTKKKRFLFRHICYLAMA
jgi:hypothetical protein